MASERAMKAAVEHYETGIAALVSMIRFVLEYGSKNGRRIMPRWIDEPAVLVSSFIQNRT